MKFRCHEDTPVGADADGLADHHLLPGSDAGRSDAGAASLRPVLSRQPGSILARPAPLAHRIALITAARAFADGADCRTRVRRVS